MDTSALQNYFIYSPHPNGIRIPPLYYVKTGSAGASINGCFQSFTVGLSRQNRVAEILQCREPYSMLEKGWDE
ncbi:hypothetical protein NT017_12710 [Prolixibacter sp. NT017]|nr:hypothetical protein NT017_12710 [Prolixibacter sp. NT017]